MRVELHGQAPSNATSLRHLDAPAQERIREVEASAAPLQSLRRTGQRPYAFNGRIIATVCGITPALPFWYELNVYETVIGSVVTDVRFFDKSDLPDLFRVAEHEDLDDAFAWFEAYDPSADLFPTRDEAPSSSSAFLSLYAARLQIQINQISEHYRSMVGDLLHALQPRLG